MLQVQQHDHEEEEDHDCAGVDDHLQRGEERGVEQDVHHGQGEERRHERQRADHRVAVQHDDEREDQRDRGEEKEDDELHHSHPFAMKSAMTIRFRRPMGRKTFQPSFIRMSYFRRGIVQRTQTKTKSRKLTFTTNAIADRMKPRKFAGSLYQGMSQPPRNSVVMSAEMAAIDMYSAMKKSANFIEEYSVWYPATSSASASEKSKGRRFVSANAATTKTMKLIHMAGERTFQAGSLMTPKRTK